NNRWNKTSEHFSPYRIISFILLGLFSIIFIFPFYWIITGAFKIQVVATQLPPQWFPLDPVLDNWVTLFKNPVTRWTFNSFFIADSEMVLICLILSTSCYVLAKKSFPGRKILFSVFVAAMALPKQVIVVPLFSLLAKLGWINTYKGLILPAVGWPFGVFLMKQFSQTIPTEILEASKIDGCSEVRTFVTNGLLQLMPAL